ncbi:hypothetical protein L5515_014709 [Caenorhabditis briggsae]|uniref:Uncharacterized protein n=1 Tax=Caenorhabditis briggsae TaxID=6238 RepID=A0AAE9EGZ1_CAEBR|nr:hypothetical protein L5515_014709 [Caenorhabditis briggsae]
MMALRILLVFFLMFAMVDVTESTSRCVHKAFNVKRVLCENSDNSHLLKSAQECCEENCSMTQMYIKCHQ